jgi:LL-diaminopimelate aminotransferase
MPKIADRLNALPPYPLTHVPQKKRELIARGVDVIDLGAGDADLAPPPAAVEALAAAAREPAMSRYGFGLGLPAFREAVVKWMHERFGQTFDPLTETIPLIGSKEGLSHLAFAYVQKGDVTIVPDPGYNAYRGGTILSDGEAYLYPITPRTNFLVELDEIPARVLKRSRILYLNYPNNPTGAVAPAEYLARVVRHCRERDILLVYDNPYCEMTFDGYVAPSIFETEGAREVAVEFHSLSKTFNMTGWRCGWACGRADVIAALARVKSFVDTGQFLPIQRAAVAALETAGTWLPGNIAVFRDRRDAAVQAFREAGFACEAPKGTMYLWIPLPDGVTSAAFAERLLAQEGVVVLPGSSLGAGGERFFRVSFITSPARIAEAARRAGAVLATFSSKV